MLPHPCAGVSLPFPAPAFSSLTSSPVATPVMQTTPLLASPALSAQAGSASGSSEGAREALKFVFSPQVSLLVFICAICIGSHQSAIGCQSLILCSLAWSCNETRSSWFSPVSMRCSPKRYIVILVTSYGTSFTLGLVCSSVARPQNFTQSNSQPQE